MAENTVVRHKAWCNKNTSKFVSVHEKQGLVRLRLLEFRLGASFEEASFCIVLFLFYLTCENEYAY
jgi:hypothetical protein